MSKSSLVGMSEFRVIFWLIVYQPGLSVGLGFYLFFDDVYFENRFKGSR